MKPPPLLSPVLKWFLLTMILANIAGNMAGGLMSLYVVSLGASVGDVGFVFTATSVAIMALQVTGGWISDSIGRLRAVAIGSVGGILGWVALFVAPSWQWMLIALVIYQIPFALVGPSFQAFIAENSTEENRGKVYGITGTVYQICGIIGPPLGGFLAGRFGFKPMIVVAALFYSVAAAVRVWLARTSRNPQEKAPVSLSFQSFKLSMTTMFGMLIAGGVLTWIFITDGVSDIAYRLSGELQPIYLQRMAGISLEQIGLLGSIFAVASMFTPMLSGKLGDRFGERLPIAGGFLLIFLAFVVFLQASSFELFALTWVIFGIGEGLLGPAYQSLISKVVPSKLLGTFSGVFESSRGFISLPAPWVGAQLWERFSPRLPFMITAGAALVVVPPIWLRFKAPDKTPGPPGTSGLEAVPAE